MWHARVNGLWHAVADEATLRDWAARGWVGPATPVYRETWAAPRYAGEVEGLGLEATPTLVPFPPLSEHDRPPLAPRLVPAASRRNRG
ncbi:MAG TPA: hypothetical protein VFS00_12175 [Polyangiaceae bacterium]|nr:hypothetical protein [Polyangiaceae bacterium]